jgi:hypothetical protein
MIIEVEDLDTRTSDRKLYGLTRGQPSETDTMDEQALLLDKASFVVVNAALSITRDVVC